jgi:DNA processing protein
MTRLQPAELSAAVLVCLPDMTPARLRLLLTRFRGPTRALAAVQRGAARDFLCDGAPPDDIPNRLARARAWELAANDDALLATIAQRRPHVLVADRPRYPIPDDVPSRPAVLLAEGAAPDALERPRVAVVGTRAATPHGLADAREVGAVLAEAGVTVVSGMAIGIDGAAHDGALEAGGTAIGVLATGLDVVYPRRHIALFERVRRAGLLMSELGYGVQPRPGAFPVRNRIIALLADIPEGWCSGERQIGSYGATETWAWTRSGGRPEGRPPNVLRGRCQQEKSLEFQLAPSACAW